jgi:hypothetical protein
MTMTPEQEQALIAERIAQERATLMADGKITDTQYRTSNGRMINRTPQSSIKSNVPAASRGMVNVTLEAHDVWSDGSGYQLLLDQTATQFGNTIPATTGYIYSGCNAPSTLYDVFSHKIPTNANPSCTTNNIVFDGSITIQIPSGTYDWCIVNPDPSYNYGAGRLWIVGDGNGEALPGRCDNYVFEEGYNYHFLIDLFEFYDPYYGWDSNDGLVLTKELDGDPCDAISNLNATVNNKDVTLTWTAAPGSPTGYKITRGATVLVASQTGTSYTDLNAPNGTHTYGVAALYEGCA